MNSRESGSLSTKRKVVSAVITRQAPGHPLALTLLLCFLKGRAVEEVRRSDRSRDRPSSSGVRVAVGYHALSCHLPDLLQKELLVNKFA